MCVVFPGNRTRKGATVRWTVAGGAAQPWGVDRKADAAIPVIRSMKQIGGSR